ncbi:MAG: hypothetical protein ACI8R4_003291 [Paracoccaceae bacterium]|jgi:hypothetical protein
MVTGYWLRGESGVGQTYRRIRWAVAQSGHRPNRSMPTIARQIITTTKIVTSRFCEGRWRAQRDRRSNQRSMSGEPHFADKRQVAVALGKVDAVAHDKFIRNFEANPV